MAWDFLFGAKRKMRSRKAEEGDIYRVAEDLKISLQYVYCLKQQFNKKTIV